MNRKFNKDGNTHTCFVVVFFAYARAAICSTGWVFAAINTYNLTFTVLVYSRFSALVGLSMSFSIISFFPSLLQSPSRSLGSLPSIVPHPFQYPAMDLFLEHVPNILSPIHQPASNLTWLSILRRAVLPFPQRHTTSTVSFAFRFTQILLPTQL